MNEKHRPTTGCSQSLLALADPRVRFEEIIFELHNILVKKSMVYSNSEKIIRKRE